jgi:phosphonate transport system substrate-binding protein
MFRTFLAMVLIAAMSTFSVAADKVRFAVTDVEGLEALQQEFGPFEKALEETTGLDIELFPVSSRTAAVEAMKSGQVEFVLTGPAEYVVIKELADPRIVVMTVMWTLWSVVLAAIAAKIFAKQAGAVSVAGES